MKLIKSVTFFGYSQADETDEEYIGAYDSAKLIAESGREIINGGGPGVMYASTKGAKDAGGKVTAVYYTPQHASQFEGKSGINIADVVEEKSNYLERTQRLMELGDAYVIFNGGTGTVSEFAMAWAVARLYFERHKPLVFFGDFWKNILDAFWKNMKVREDAYKVFRYANTPQQVMEHLKEYEEIYKRYQGLPPEKCEGDECELFLKPYEIKRAGKVVAKPGIKEKQEARDDVKSSSQESTKTQKKKDKEQEVSQEDNKKNGSAKKAHEDDDKLHDVMNKLSNYS